MWRLRQIGERQDGCPHPRAGFIPSEADLLASEAAFPKREAEQASREIAAKKKLKLPSLRSPKSRRKTSPLRTAKR